MLSPGAKASTALGITRSWAKMEEFAVPAEHRIDPKIKLTAVADLALGILGDHSATWDIEENPDVPLEFVAKYFDALGHSGPPTTTTEYARLLAAASYYLSDFAGNAAVLSKHPLRAPVEPLGFAEFLRRFLADPRSLGELQFPTRRKLQAQLEECRSLIVAFLGGGMGAEDILTAVDELRLLTYRFGEPRQVVLADLIRAAVRRHVVRTSPWVKLPEFSGLPVKAWSNFLAKRSPIRELWPSQLAIGAKGVLGGTSASIQVPTSGGKTKAVSLVIRSAFLSKRAEHAVVVAPFNALCREIAADFAADFRDDLNVQVGVVPDTRNADTGGLLIRRQKAIAILTPEKLDYLLRINPALAEMIGLIVYDEGHLIDSPGRGPMFELLLASLKGRLKPETQVLFISAVTPNIKDIGNWLVGADCAIISGANLLPTSRSYALVNWEGGRRLEFISPKAPDTDEFWVPRLLEEYDLDGRDFPAIRTTTKNGKRVSHRDPGHIAILLASRLSKSGGVAIFCGRKDTAVKLSGEAADAFNSALPVDPPNLTANKEELEILAKYLDNTLEPNCAASRACRVGILVHHGNMPSGARLCVEHAIQQQHAKVVLCTSTLAQGVNLPIRYLLVSSTVQGGSPIAARDFHNLIGRAGRAGKFTEGVVIFTDPRLFIARKRGAFAWRATSALLDARSTDACASRLLHCLQAPPDNTLLDRWKSEVAHCTTVIESFLLLSLGEVEEEDVAVAAATAIATSTLAYAQGTASQRDKLTEVFTSAAKRVIGAKIDIAKRVIFARTGNGIADSIKLDKAVAAKLDDIDPEHPPGNVAELLAFWWPVLYSTASGFLVDIPRAPALKIAQQWIAGRPLAEIKTSLVEHRHGGNNRRFSIEDCVGLCEDSFGYRLSLTVGAIAELLGKGHEQEAQLRLLQRGLKAGLDDVREMIIFDSLFPDRRLAKEVNTIIGDTDPDFVFRAMANDREKIGELVATYPDYFRNRFASFVEEN